MSQGKGMLRADVDDSLLGYSLRPTGLHSRSYDGLEHHLRLLFAASEPKWEPAAACDHDCPLDGVSLRCAYLKKQVCICCLMQDCIGPCGRGVFDTVAKETVDICFCHVAAAIATASRL
jgi:hypothetical protein